ncbi:MAG: hypothetical protein HC888_05825 [Candidatus Competibacteraceae bacterium]|nr:hypothetical protein [Candidatus Competibacteraceae bacterium]
MKNPLCFSLRRSQDITMLVKKSVMLVTKAVTNYGPEALYVEDDLVIHRDHPLSADDILLALRDCDIGCFEYIYIVVGPLKNGFPKSRKALALNEAWEVADPSYNAYAIILKPDSRGAYAFTKALEHEIGASVDFLEDDNVVFFYDPTSELEAIKRVSADEIAEVLPLGEYLSLHYPLE